MLGLPGGAVFVLVGLVDLELLGLTTVVGIVDGLVGLEGLLGVTDLVVFKEAGGVGAAVGMEGPVEAGDMLGLEDLFGGEGMVGGKGLVALDVMVHMKDLVAVGSDLTAVTGLPREVIVATEGPGGRVGRAWPEAGELFCASLGGGSALLGCGDGSDPGPVLRGLQAATAQGGRGAMEQSRGEGH